MSVGTVQLPSTISFGELAACSRSRDANDRRMAVLRTQAAAETMLHRLGYEWGPEQPLNGFRAAIRRAAADKKFDVPMGLPEAVEARNSLTHEDRIITEQEAGFAWVVYEGLLRDLARLVDGDNDVVSLSTEERAYRFVIEPPPDGILFVSEDVAEHAPSIVGYWAKTFRPDPRLNAVFMPGTDAEVHVIFSGSSNYVLTGVALHGLARVWASRDGLHIEFNAKDAYLPISRRMWWWKAMVSAVGWTTMIGVGSVAWGLALGLILWVFSIVGFHPHWGFWLAAILVWMFGAVVALAADFRSIARTLRPKLSGAHDFLGAAGEGRASTLLPWAHVRRFSHEMHKTQELRITTTHGYFRVGFG